MARKNPTMSKSSYIALNQKEGNPVGNQDNTDKGAPKRNVPKQKNSGSKALSQKVVHPVANKRNTGAGL
jgi:hypothetical protein